MPPPYRPVHSNYRSRRHTPRCTRPYCSRVRYTRSLCTHAAPNTISREPLRGIQDYIDYADPSINRNAASGGGVTNWEVVLSGFFDSVGLRGCAVTPSHEQEARRLVERLGLQDLISHPPPRGCTAASASASAASASAASAGEAGRVSQTFFHLSHGQQKLVLLCRALVKRPRLLLLDEPTHGLSGHNRERLLETLASLADDAESPAVVYVTHRSDEIEALEYENVLQLTGGAAADGSGWRVVRTPR